MGKSLEHVNCKVKKETGKRAGRPCRPPAPAVDMDRRSKCTEDVMR